MDHQESSSEPQEQEDRQNHQAMITEERKILLSGLVMRFWGAFGFALLALMMATVMISAHFERKFREAFDVPVARAMYARDVPVATREIRQAIAYLESEGLTTGYTWRVRPTENENIGTWYRWLIEIEHDFEQFPANATQIEQAIFLTRMRDRLIGEQGHVRQPRGMGTYPRNEIFAVWFLLSGIGALIALAVAFDAWCTGTMLRRTRNDRTLNSL